MDDKTFTAVSLIVAGAGAVGSAIGLNRLCRNRLADRQHIAATVESDIHPRNDKTRSWAEDVYDYGRTLGTLGISTLYGMAVYPLTPCAFLPILIARDYQGKGYSRSFFRH